MSGSGNIPLMNSLGTSIVNGIYRIVINQILQSPGIYYRSELGNIPIHRSEIYIYELKGPNDQLCNQLLESIGLQEQQLLIHPLRYSRKVENPPDRLDPTSESKVGSTLDLTRIAPIGKSQFIGPFDTIK
ncbi:RNA polymerase beta subunit [Olea europaea subsp. europaea]|uniref:RNA polymerase beta subunit (Chloroplast) n=1 Tax=Olea europaea subsp. europaea TaxID=158383 RepID=A0A8S0Q6D5_OLEEU|nr:RNA polymerase beta subunit [Olea europaea subsp. europaea]